MLISAGRIVRDGSEVNVLSTSSREICWVGLIYKSGLKAGAESLHELAGAREEDISRVAAELKGIYFVAVHCKDSGNIYAFVDQAGLYHAYFSPNFIGNSFLELVRLERYKATDVDPEALVEFLHLGRIYADRTFFSEIRKIEPDTVLRSRSVGPAAILSKGLSDIALQPSRSFESILSDFVLAIRGERVSMDITGGADTRLLATVLSYLGLPFEMATSGRPGIPDLEIGAKVAKALGHPFFPTYHSAESVNWDELFLLSDGMFDVSKNSRLIQLQRDRKSRGISLSISGAGGELFSENWWMQDFPFYTRRQPRIDRLFSLRIAPQLPQHSFLTNEYRALSEQHRQKIIRQLSHFAVPSNTKSYDRVFYYFHLRSTGGSFLSSSAKILMTTVPYTDREIASIGYNLPRLDRIFSRFHRKLITRYSREAAQLPTTDGGVTLRSGVLPLSSDLRRYLADRSMRLTKKLGQQVFGKTIFQESSDDPRTVDELRRMLELRKSTEVLADHGIFRYAAEPCSIPKQYLGAVFVLGRFIEQLDQQSAVPETARASRSIFVGSPKEKTFGAASQLRATS